MTAEWVSQKLRFPIKIVNHTAEDTFTELRDIREGPLADALFQLPAGYAKMEVPGAGGRTKPAAAPQ